MKDRFDTGAPGPDIDEFVEKFRQYGGRHAGKFVLILLAMVVLIAALSGFYSVGPGEQGVVRTFGRESGKSGPGLHYSAPLIQRVDVVNMDQVRRIEVGFRGSERLANEALMLTGDENMVEAQMIVQYRVTDPSKYLFRLEAPEEALQTGAEVALRGMVGRTTIDDAMTTGREKVQAETLVFLQSLMDAYQSGLTITEVKLQVVDAPDEVRESFHDVVRAREEKEQKINQARGYAADLIPRARGEAEQMTRSAEAYREQRVLRANGDRARFLSLLGEYQKAQRVTRDRLHLETIERVLGAVQNKTLIDVGVGRGALPLLDLNPPAAAPVSGAGQPGSMP